MSLATAVPEARESIRLPETNQALKPFEVNVDWLPDYIPETVAFVEVLRTEGADIQELSDTLDERAHEESIGVSRKLIRKGEHAYSNLTFNELIAATTFLVDEIDDPNIRMNKVSELIGPCIQETVYFDFTMQGLVSSVEHYRKALRGIRHNTYSFVEGMETDIADNPLARYEITKVAASIDYDPRSLETKDAFISMLAIQAVESDGGLLKVFHEELKQGVYDKFIARDLMLYLESGKNGLHLDHLAVLRDLIQTCAPEVAPDILRERLVDSVGQWPADARLSIVTSRTALANDIGQKIRKGIEAVREYGIRDPSTDPQERFDAAIDGLILLLAKLGQMKNTPAAKAQAVRANVASKRRLKQAMAANGHLEKQDNTPEEAPLQPKSFALLDMAGNLYDANDPKFIKLVTEYKASHKGAPHFEDDVQNALDYLTKLDLSKGLVKGLKKYGDSITTLDGTSRDVYEFKPSDPGVLLSMHSSAAKKIRILFAQTDEHVCIIDIMDRDQLVNARRNRGLSVSASTR